MSRVRRIYTYLVSAVSFTVVFFAVESLLRIWLVPTWPGERSETALQLALVIIGLPIYLGHWIWQERKVHIAPEERAALERRIYLYLLIGGAVAVAAVSGYDLLVDTFRLEFRPERAWSASWPVNVEHVIPIGLSCFVWLYHTRLLRLDCGSYPDTGALGAVRRLYIYLFSGAGLLVISFSLYELLRWTLGAISHSLMAMPAISLNWRMEIPRIIIGLILWLTYWLWAQRLYRTGGEEEKESVLRKFFLYLAAFVGTAGAVTNAALLLAGFFRSLLELESQGDIRDVLASLAVFGLVWFYHSRVLAEDTRMIRDTARQAEMRRLYWYLLAAIGLIAWLAGLIGDISTLIFVWDEGMNDSLREQLAYFTAAMLAGLPVWLLTWRRIQAEASLPDQMGRWARESLTRKIYLYFFLLVSILAVLGSAVYVVYQGLDWLLFNGELVITDLAIPLAVALIQLLVWLYHLATLNSDRRLSEQDELRSLQDLRLVLLEDGSGTLDALIQRLQKAAPGLHINLFGAHEFAMAQAEARGTTLAQIAQAEVIVAPWTLFLPTAEDGTTPALADALATSPAQKIVLPVTNPYWRWVGIESMSEDKTAEEAVDVLKRIVAGDEIRPRRRWGCGAVALAIIGLIVLSQVIVPLISMLFYGF